MASIASFRDTLCTSNVFMNHSGAWGIKELESCPDGRLCGVMLRLMYLHALAIPGEPRTVSCVGSLVRYKMTEPFLQMHCDAVAPELRTALRKACEVLDSDPHIRDAHSATSSVVVAEAGDRGGRGSLDGGRQSESSEKIPSLFDRGRLLRTGIVVHIRPEEAGQVAEERIAALSKACCETCVFYVLCGDSEVLPAPKSEEEETARGLSALQIGMCLTDAFEANSMTPGPLVVCEFPRENLDGVLPAQANISSHQLTFLCEGQRCMQVTETWKLYSAKGSKFAAFHDREETDPEEERWWIDALKDAQACGNCGTLHVELRCSRCRKMSYCDRHCQKAHWKFHKAACNSNPAVPYAPSSTVQYQ